MDRLLCEISCNSHCALDPSLAALLVFGAFSKSYQYQGLARCVLANSTRDASSASLGQFCSLVGMVNKILYTPLCLCFNIPHIVSVHLHLHKLYLLIFLNQKWYKDPKVHRGSSIVHPNKNVKLTNHHRSCAASCQDDQLVSPVRQVLMSPKVFFI